MSHKPNMNINTIFAAVLIAGIVGMLAGFISRQIITPEFLHEDAFPIEVTETSGAGGAAGPTGPEPILGLLATADAAKGQAISKQCAACHDFAQGGPNRVGPDLYGVVGRPKGKHAGFAYSEGMAAKGGNWTYEDLNHFLWKPKSYVAGTKMNFIGLKKPQDRADLLAWLSQQGGTLPMPSATDIAAEQAELAPAPAEVPAAADGKTTPTPEAGKTDAPATAPADKASVPATTPETPAKAKP